MADKNWLVDVQLSQKIGQRAQAFLVHVGDGPGLGQRIGVAIAVARVDGHGAAGDGGDTRREIFPVRDRAQRPS
jgi:hypothetical protein